MKRQESELNSFCKKTGLLPDRSRQQAYGFGRSTAQKAVWKNKKQKVDTAANSAIRNTGRVLEFNSKASFRINIDEYDQAIIDELSSASKGVAELGSKDDLEHLILVDLSNGSHSYSEVGNHFSVGFEKFREYVKEHKNQRFAFVHNHNTDGYFSETDMRTPLTTDNNDMFVAARIDGVIYCGKNTNRSQLCLL